MGRRSVDGIVSGKGVAEVIGLDDEGVALEEIKDGKRSGSNRESGIVESLVDFNGFEGEDQSGLLKYVRHV